MQELDALVAMTAEYIILMILYTVLDWFILPREKRKRSSLSI